MRTPTLLVTLLFAALLYTLARGEDATSQPPQSKIEESAKSVQELQKERMAVLNELVDDAANTFRSSPLPVAEEADAYLMLSRAELEAAENESERLSSYSRLLARLNQLEEIASARKAAARGTTFSVLKVKALRLEAEINLKRAKARVAEEAK